MNFTHLIKGTDEPDQELLQRFSHYVVVVALSDDIIDFVLDATGFEMRSSDSALCWVVCPKHLRTAPPGSALSRLNELVQSHCEYRHIEHSFIATASREELSSSKPDAGMYIPLNFRTEDDQVKRTETLRSAVTVALSRSEPKKQSGLIDLLNLIVSAAAFVKDVFNYER